MDYHPDIENERDAREAMEPPRCPHCAEWINADNDLMTCEVCEAAGCEDCLGEGPACYACENEDEGD